MEQQKRLISRVIEENSFLKKQLQLEMNLFKRTIDNVEWKNNELNRKQSDLVQKLQDRNEEMDALRRWRNKESAMDKSHIETLEYILEIAKLRTNAIQSKNQTHIQEIAKEKNELDEQREMLMMQKYKLKKSVKKHLNDKDELFVEQNRLELKDFLLKEEKDKVELLKLEYNKSVVQETKDLLKERKDLQTLQFELFEKEKLLESQKKVIEKEKFWLRNIYKSVAIAGFVLGCGYILKNKKC